MRRGLAFGLAACCVTAACGVRLDGGQPSGPDADPSNPDAAVEPDASTDGPAPLGPWGPPQRITAAASSLIEDDASLSSTGLELFFSVVDAAANNKKDLWTMKRTSVTAPWGAPAKLSFDTTTYSEETARLSDDDLTLYFASDRPGGPGLLDIYKTTRTAVGGAWSTPQLVPGVSTAQADKWFMPCSGTNSYMVIFGPEIGQGTLGAQPTVCAELSSAQTETGTFLSQDCKTVHFASNRSGTNKLYTSTRTAVGATWGAPQEVTTFSGVGGAQEDPWIAADSRTFVFVSDVTGSKDVYISTR
jgi:hypothetical protein